MTVGVLALQGDFAEHCRMLSKIRCPNKEVRSLEELASVDRLIIPGGESTVIGSFLHTTGISQEIIRRNEEGSLPLFGTCAGAIVLAKDIVGTPAPSLNLVDISIERNAYGRQMQSFRTALNIRGIEEQVDASFIRAPKILQFGRAVEVLAEHEGTPVLVRQGDVLVSTFHAELTDSPAIHELFVV